MRHLPLHPHLRAAPPTGLARLAAIVLFLPAFAASAVATWRARRRLRAYGPAAVLAPDHFARLRIR